MWCRTQALRFLPGGFWAPAARATIVRGRVRDRLAVVGAENVAGLCAALAVGGLAFAASGRPPWAALAPVLAAPAVAAHAIRERVAIAPGRAWQGTLWYVAAFVAYGAHAALVQLAVSGSCDPLAVAGAGAIAWAAGLVVVVAPSGVGVRELVYVALLSGSLPSGELAAAAVASRLVTIVAELLVLVAVGRPGRSLPQRL
jgi:glycosyltransferase 2 family protein